MQEGNPRDWHRILSKTLWAYMTSKRNSTRVSPFSLTYGQDAVFPMKEAVHSLRVSKKYDLTPQEYSEVMMMELELENDKEYKPSTIC